MAIEQLNSAITYQASSAKSQQSTKDAQTVEKTAAEYTDCTAQGTTQLDDSKTLTAVQNDLNRREDYAKSVSESEKEQKQQQLELEKIRKAVEDLNKNLPNSEAIFGIHEATSRVMIKIVDKETRELVRELPPEKTLDMIAKVWEMAGLIVDERR